MPPVDIVWDKTPGSSVYSIPRWWGEHNSIVRAIYQGNADFFNHPLTQWSITLMPLPVGGGMFGGGRLLNTGRNLTRSANLATKGVTNAVTRSESVLGHIFRNAPGHVNPSTVASQNRYIKLFESVANNPANLN
jgi:hypothetical protein